MKSRNQQIRKEIFWTVILYVFYFVWWYFFAYYFGEGDVSDYKYVLGLPEWFFYSCVLGLVVINVLAFIVIKLFFKNMPLGDEGEKEC